MLEVFPQIYPPLNIEPAAKAAASRGMEIRAAAHYIDVVSANRVIRVALKHLHYVYDIVTSYESYFSAVVPIQQAGMHVVDYSTPRWHEIIGFDLHPIRLPSFAEPVITTNEYITLAQLRDGCIVMDLGAYSGLTSILFDREVAPTGRVIAVEADAASVDCLRKNLRLYERFSGRKIEILEGAIWKDEEGIEFSVEGNMGAALSAIVGRQRGENRRVPSFTLSSIARNLGLERLDFIKCDIEGAEAFVFGDEEFFRRYRPLIVIEPHVISGKLTTATCIQSLAPCGYDFKEVPQAGVLQYGNAVPLLMCMPKSA